jgi:hypothetical protein
MCALEIVSEDNNKRYCSNRMSGVFTKGDNEVLLAFGKENGRVFLENFEGHHSCDGFFLIRKDGREGLNVSSLGRFNGNDFDDIFGQLGIKLVGNEITLSNGVCLRACRSRL